MFAAQRVPLSILAQEGKLSNENIATPGFEKFEIEEIRILTIKVFVVENIKYPYHK